MHSRPDLLNPFDDHALSRLDSIADDPEGADLVADGDRLNAHRVVLVHGRDLIAALEFGDGLLRNKQGIVDGFNRDPHFPVLPRAENITRIVE